MSQNQESLTRTSRIAGLVTSLGVIAAGLSGCEEPAPPAPPILDIPVVEVVQRDVPIVGEFVGQTRGSVDIPISARVAGFLESIDFLEGRYVEEGDLLYTIDDNELQSKVAEARGYVAEATTMLAKAASDLDRIRPLAEMKAVSQQDLDSAVAQYEAAQGALTAANAQLEQARIELSYSRIYAPTSGFIGISAAKVGGFVGVAPNPVVLNYVSKIDPIRVQFSVNEREYLRYARKFSEARSRITRDEDDTALELILADGSVHPQPGHVVSAEAAINPSTGTLMLEADFPNPKDIVIAGQFARVRAILDTRMDALLVPQRAVSELQGNFRVFVVDQNNTVSIREVKPGPTVDRMWVIDSGLEPGERVAVEGLLRMTGGMVVNPKLISLDQIGQPLPGPGGD
ncbi:MAG: efflux RND transporter periplasmic adaptor subunit [Gammaproteobacteria bacterium]